MIVEKIEYDEQIDADGPDDLDVIHGEGHYGLYQQDTDTQEECEPTCSLPLVDGERCDDKTDGQYQGEQIASESG